MKDHPERDADEQRAAEDALFAAVLALREPAECRAFFEDLCTPTELQAMTDRWLVAMLLDQGLTYRSIHDRTGVSLTTIGRVARYLNRGAGGYTAALRRTRKPKP
ncbi:MAG: helix-turn-helix domain-containing protein [Chromatiales bacterium]|nr:helix-turn-helix domain-containing protein [Chromatiales bacterium]